MEKHKIIGEMYGVLLMIEEEFDEKGLITGFDKYSKKRILELYEKAFEWRIEDEREKIEQINK